MNIQFPSTLINATAPPDAQPTTSGTTFRETLAQASAPPDKLAQTAQQFEALMIGQVLKAARASSDGGWLGGGDDDPSGDMTMELAEQQLAQALGSRGGLGIAKLVTQNLDRNKTKAASSGPEQSSSPSLPSKDPTH